MAQFTTLYSGSSGNCGLVLSGGKYLLLDVGKSCRITTNALKELGLPLSDCQGILVTHEHSDHVSGLRVFLKNTGLPVYGRAETLYALECKGILPPAAEAVAMEDRLEEIGGFEVRAFPTSHDVPCCGYRIRTPEGSVMTMATDLGVLTPAVNQNLSGVDLVALEANYEPYNLRYGTYARYLKERIASAQGHLSNQDCAAKVLELMQQGCRKFALCHLSRENNTPELALAAVRAAVAESGFRPDPDVLVQVQRRDEISPMIEF